MYSFLPITETELKLSHHTLFTNSEIFTTAKQKLKQHIVNWGYQANKGDYFDILKSADVAVSTALHEFFGVSM